MWWLLLLAIEGTDEFRASTVYASETLCLAAQVTEEDRCIPVEITLATIQLESLACEND